MEKYLNRIIDHTFLKPNASPEEFEAFCGEAAEYNFVCVALLPNFVSLGAKLLQDANVNVMAAVSYPRGQVARELKKIEIEDALFNGADEIDMVLNLHAIKKGDFTTISREMEMLRELTPGKTCKVILETSLLEDKEIAVICTSASEIGLDFVKTSTGFDGNKATIHAVQVMKKHTFGTTKVKAAGGINTLDQMLKMVRAGADRIGTSMGPALMVELKRSGRSFEELISGYET